MTYYDIMFEAIENQYESGEITFEQAEELNDLAYDRYMTEMKSQAEYRERKLKEKYNYDPKTKTLNIDGERVPFKVLYRKDRTEDYGPKTNKHIDDSHYGRMNNEETGARRLMKKAIKDLDDSPFTSIVNPGASRVIKNEIKNRPGTISLDSNVFKYGHKKRPEVELLHEFTHRNEDKLKRKIANGTATEKEKKEYEDIMKKISEFHNSNSKRTVNEHDAAPFETLADKKAVERVGEKAFNKTMNKLYGGYKYKNKAKCKKEIKDIDDLVTRYIPKSMTKEREVFDNAKKEIPYRYGAETRDVQKSLKYRKDALKAANRIDKGKNTEK